MSPLLCLVGGIHLSGASGNSVRTSSACASSSRNESAQVRVDLEGVAEAQLPVLEPGALGEGLVDELADAMTVWAASTASAVVR